MKITQVLFKQHLERMARRHWYIQGKKIIPKTKAEEYVKQQGFEVLNAVEELNVSKRELIRVDPKLQLFQDIPRDVNHPDFKEDPCFIYGDNNVLVEGLKQAQVLTNTTIAGDDLPSSLENLEKNIKVPEKAHNELKKKILMSCVFDAEQKKLPIKKDPLRPAWVFPRDYGITDSRKNKLLCLHILSLVEVSGKRDLSVAEDVEFSLPIKEHGKQLQFELTAEVLLTGKKQLSASRSSNDNELIPDLYPLDCTVSIQHQHFYNILDFYPVSSSEFKHVHTAMLHFNPSLVKNLYDTPVTEDQAAGRLLIKAFTIAACEAKSLQQGSVKEPVSVQAVQTDGQNFQFAVFQLNSLDLRGIQRNRFWISPLMPLYSTCSYVNGRPTLEGYNPLVLQRLSSFISNR